MNKYKVIAHQENNKSFSLTFEAFTTKHAGALFVSEMDRRRGNHFLLCFRSERQ